MWTHQLLQPLPPHNLFHSSYSPSNLTKNSSFAKLNSTHNIKTHNEIVNSTIITLEDLPPNALRRMKGEEWIGGFSLGVDLGMARTGLALSRGYSVRPLTVTTISFT
jgi:putative Holliday junction resolvase